MNPMIVIGILALLGCVILLLLWLFAKVEKSGYDRGFEAGGEQGKVQGQTQADRWWLDTERGVTEEREKIWREGR